MVLPPSTDRRATARIGGRARQPGYNIRSSFLLHCVKAILAKQQEIALSIDTRRLRSATVALGMLAAMSRGGFYKRCSPDTPPNETCWTFGE